tara:strand:- start:151 stop:384 length:234 start_codon:yes stop_codon:yes gene_type:complete
MAVEKKNECVISRESFLAAAKPLDILVNGIPMTAEIKEFSTGSFGFYLNGKVTLVIDEKRVPLQVGGNFTVVNSKPK